MHLLPPLPYALDALRPVIGEETMQTHHGKHHARYVRVVNELLAVAQETPQFVAKVGHRAVVP